MVIVIKQRSTGGLEVEEYSRAEWDTMMTALDWKENGQWAKIKDHVHKRGLNRK